MSNLPTLTPASTKNPTATGSAIAPTIATQGNRLNTDGQLAASAKNRGQTPYVGVMPAAGSTGSTLTVPIAGTNFYVFASTGTLNIQATGYNSVPYVQGTGENFSPIGGSFQSLTIVNPNAFAVSFTIIIGSPEFIDKRNILVPGSFLTGMPVQAQTSVVRGIGITSIVDSSTFFVDGQRGLSLGYGFQKQIVIKNTDTSRSLTLSSAVDGALIYTLSPGEPWTLETSAGININNNSGGTASVCGSQTFYTAVAGVQQ